MLKFYDLVGNEITLIKFGRIRLGDSKDITLKVKNTEESLLVDLKFTSNNPEVIILTAPTGLGKLEEVILQLRCTPKTTLVEGISCKIDWSADEVWGE